MMRRFAAGLINVLLHQLERTSTAADQCAFLQEQLVSFARHPEKLDTLTQNDLHQAWQTAVEMGILTGDQPFIGDRPWPYRSLEKTQTWLASLPGGKPFAKAGFSSGLGQCLELLDSANHPAAPDLLERTLRHVEVKRQDCLSTPLGGNPSAPWLERFDVLLAFCRAARRHKDLRFLNAAFKMTGWYARRCRSAAASSAERARFLLAVATQEACAREFDL